MTPEELLRVLSDSVRRLDEAARATDEDGEPVFNDKAERQLQLTSAALWRALQESGRVAQQDTNVEITIVDSLSSTDDSSQEW